MINPTFPGWRGFLADIRRIPRCFGGFSVPLTCSARKFNRWLAVPAAKSLGLPPPRAGAHHAAFIRAYLDPRPLHLLPLPLHARAGGARSRAISDETRRDGGRWSSRR